MKDKNYFSSAFLTILIGGLIFFLLKPILPKKLFNADNSATNNIVIDSFMQKAILEMEVDSAKLNLPSQTIDTIKKNVIEKPIKKNISSDFINISDFDFNIKHPTDSLGNQKLLNKIKLKSYNGNKHLRSFYKKLIKLEKGAQTQVRIAYYGDSSNDGDLIVQDFRSQMQSRFGGKGVGFVPITSESANTRYSVKHKIYGNWKNINYLKTRSTSDNFGVNGAVNYAIDSFAKIQYNSSGIKNSYKLYNPVLYYGVGNDSVKLSYIIDKDTVKIIKSLNKTNQLNKIQLSKSNIKSLKIDFSKALNIPLYGLTFDNGKGIAVDNFSNRGNSGLPLSILNQNLMRDFNKSLSYDLIILQFGANILSTKLKSFNWYVKKMEKTIIHLKKCFPNAEIIVLGTTDKGTKKGLEIRTDSSVVRLLQSQQKLAANTTSGFISLFHLMGGVHTMPIWVKAKPKLANADYTHFNSRGSQKMGKLITKELLLGYDAYKARVKDSLKKIKIIKPTVQQDSISINH